MKFLFLNQILDRVSGPSVRRIMEMEPGITVENVRSQFLSLGGYQLVQVRNQIQEGVECAGLGVDKDTRVALIKAFSEYFERKAVITEGEALGFDSTNGVASHRFELLAKHAAYSELVERDAFLAHWYSQSAFQKIDQLPTNLSGMISALQSGNLRTLFFVTTLGFEQATVCFIVDKQTGGFVIGLSAGRVKLDIEKALQEAIINFELGGYGFSKEQLLEDYAKDGLSNLQAHRTYWLYKSILPDWVIKGPPCKKSKPMAEIPGTQFVRMAQKPFVVVGAKNGAMLPLTLGMSTADDLMALTRRVEFDSQGQGERFIHPIP